ncbi:hypothetical protein THAOC_27188, partial [Thalassiosira oceanica]
MPTIINLSAPSAHNSCAIESCLILGEQIQRLLPEIYKIGQWIQKDHIKQMKDDDDHKTDGRKKIKLDDDWEAFFESIERTRRSPTSVMMNKRTDDGQGFGQARSSSRESSRALKKLDLAKTEVTKKSLKSL